MDFALSSEQEDCPNPPRVFEKELAPRSREWDGRASSVKVWRQMGELGLLGLRIPSAYAARLRLHDLRPGHGGNRCAGDFGCTSAPARRACGEIVGATGTKRSEALVAATARGEEVYALA